MLQVYNVKTMDGGSRYAISLADGEFVVRAVAFKGSGLAQEVETRAVGIHTLIRVKTYDLTLTPSGPSVLCINQVDVLGTVPDHWRVPASSLKKFTVGRTQVDSGLTQADPSAGAYTTPERRGPPVGLAGLTPQPQPQQPGPVPWGLVDESFAQAETQDCQGAAAAAAQLSAAAPAPGGTPWNRPGAAPAPYSTPPAAAGPAAPGHPNAGGLHPGQWQQGGSAPSTGGANPYSAAFAPGGAAAPAAGAASGQAFGPYSGGGAAVAAAPVPGPGLAAPARKGRGGGILDHFGQRPVAAAAGSCMPIIQLSPYLAGRWRIKARVTTKSDIRRFTNARGEGQLFKVDLADKSGTVSATFFGKAVDLWFPVLRPGQVFFFSKGHIKTGNPRFDRSEHVLTFEEHAIIEPTEEDQDIPGVQYNFIDLSQVQNADVNTLLDVKAVIFDVKEPFTFTAKSQKEMTKRELGLWDCSGTEGFTCMELVLWGDRAFGTFEVGTVIFIKDARVGEWQQSKNLSGPQQMELNVDDDRAFELKRRFDEFQQSRPLPSIGMNRASGNSNTRKTLEACRLDDVNLSMAPPATQALDPSGPRSVHRHLVLATVTSIPTDRMPCYPSCPELVEKMGTQTSDKRPCSKKVIDEGSGGWRCAAGHICQQPTYRYLCRMEVMDASESLEVNLYDAHAKQLFGCEAQDYARAWEDEDREGQLHPINKRVLWRRVVLKLRAQKEVWQEAERVRYSVDEVSSIPWVKEASHMLSEVLQSLAVAPPCP